MNNFWKNKKVLVTGGAGFIGSNVAELLLKKGSFVTMTISPNSQNQKLKSNLESFRQRLTIQQTDLLELNDCLKATRNQQIVLNFAALDGGYFFKKSYPALIFRTNTQIVLNMLEASRRNKVDRFLLMSSIDVYSKDCVSPIKENEGFKGNLDLDNGYAWSKRVTEIASKTYYNQYGLKIAIARPGNVYGPCDITNQSRSRVIKTMIMNAINGEDLCIIGNPQTKKSFLYIDDLIISLLKLVQNYAVNDPVNIVSNNYVSIEFVAKLIIKFTKSRSKIKIISDNNIKGSQERFFSIKKALSKIKFLEKTSFETGLQNTINDHI